MSKILEVEVITSWCLDGSLELESPWVIAPGASMNFPVLTPLGSSPWSVIPLWISPHDAKFNTEELTLRPPLVRPSIKRVSVVLFLLLLLMLLVVVAVVSTEAVIVVVAEGMVVVSKEHGKAGMAWRGKRVGTRLDLESKIVVMTEVMKPSLVVLQLHLLR